MMIALALLLIMLNGCPINKLEINYKTVKQNGSRSGPKLIRSQSGSKCISANHKSKQKQPAL